MFNGGNVPSLSDIAAVTGKNSNDGFGGNNGWWILIILFALFGWGRGGYSFEGGSNGYATPGDIQRGFDNQGVTNKLNGLENGLASLGYDQLSQMNGINTNVMTVGNTLQSQLASCCCENRQAIAQVRYDLATNTCNLNNSINQMGQQIMQNDNANYRQLHDEIVAMKMEAKDETIAQLRMQVNNLSWQASQEAQTCRLERSIHPQATPAYVVANPYCNCGNGYNNGGCCN